LDNKKGPLGGLGVSVSLGTANLSFAPLLTLAYYNKGRAHQALLQLNFK